MKNRSAALTELRFHREKNPFGSYDHKRLSSTRRVQIDDDNNIIVCYSFHTSMCNNNNMSCCTRPYIPLLCL